MHAREVLEKATVASSQTLYSRAILQDLVQEGENRLSGCLLLLFSLIYFGIYLATASTYSNPTISFLLQTEFRHRLEGSAQSLSGTEDVWPWLNSTLVPLFFTQTDMYGDQVAPDDSRVLTYGQLQGAVVLEQTRSTKEACKSLHGLLPVQVTCHPTSALSTDPFGSPLSTLTGINTSVLSSPSEGFVASQSVRRLSILRDEIAPWLPAAGDSGQVFRFWLQSTSSYTEVQQRLNYLRLRGWLDDQTSYVSIKALVLNLEISTMPIHRVKVDLAFSRGGGIFPSLRFERIFLRPLSNFITSSMAVILALFVAADTAVALGLAIKSLRQEELREHLFRSTTLLVWLTVLSGWATLILGLIVEVALNKQMIKDLNKLQAATASSRVAAGEALAASSDLAFNVSSYHRLLITYMNILLMFRCFVAMGVQPKLAMVLRTLKETSVDVVHFLIIFLATFAAFAVAGVMVFGKRFENFSSFVRAFGMCVQIVTEVQYDWVSLSVEDFWTAVLWVWAFMLLVSLLMLNMLLVIIMDVYAEVSSSTDSTETVWETVAYSVMRIYLHRKWIGRPLLSETLRSMPGIITDEEFTESFPNMPSFQREFLLHSARVRSKALMRLESQDQWSLEMAAATKLCLDNVLENLKDLSKQRERSAEENRTSDVAAMKDIGRSISVQTHWISLIQSQMTQLREYVQVLTTEPGTESWDITE